MNDQPKGRIVVTTTHEYQGGMVQQMGSDLYTVYHFSGLYFGHLGTTKDDPDKIAYLRDLGRLGKILQEEEAHVLVMCVLSRTVPYNIMKIARFAIEHAGVQSVIVAAAPRVTDDSVYGLQVFEINTEGLSLLNSFKQLSGEGSLRMMMDFARDSQKRIVEESAQAA